MNYYKRISNYILNCKSGFKRMQVTKLVLPVTGREADALRNSLAMRLVNNGDHFGYIRLDQSETSYFYLITYADQHNEILKLSLSVSSWSKVQVVETFSCDSDLALAVLVKDAVEQVGAKISTSSKNLPPIAVRKLVVAQARN